MTALIVFPFLLVVAADVAAAFALAIEVGIAAAFVVALLFVLFGSFSF